MFRATSWLRPCLLIVAGRGVPATTGYGFFRARGSDGLWLFCVLSGGGPARHAPYRCRRLAAPVNRTDAARRCQDPVTR